MQKCCYRDAVLATIALGLLEACTAPADSPAAGNRMFSSPAASRKAFSPLEDHPTAPTSTININPDFNQKASF